MEEVTFILREHEEGPLMRPGRSGKALELKDRRYTVEGGLKECSRQWKNKHAKDEALEESQWVRCRGSKEE